MSRSFWRALLLAPPTVYGPPPTAIPSTRATALKPDAFCRIWRDTREDSEGYQAVQQLLAHEIVFAIDLAADPALADKPGLLAHRQGAVAALIELSASLDRARTEPEAWTPDGPPRKTVGGRR